MATSITSLKPGETCATCGHHEMTREELEAEINRIDVKAKSKVKSTYVDDLRKKWLDARGAWEHSILVRADLERKLEAVRKVLGELHYAANIIVKANSQLTMGGVVCNKPSIQSLYEVIQKATLALDDK